MGIEAPAKVMYGIIYETMLQEGSQLDVSGLCKLAGVSRSGYYSWLNNADKRKQREENDYLDFQIILEAYKYRGYAKGARSIYMRLLHEDKRMNLKKIRRLMKKYNLRCPIRRLNPYKAMMRDMRTNHVSPNVVNRGFRKHGASKVLLTDITYLFYRGNNVCYLSTIIDAYTHQVLSYRLSESLEVQFVLDTVDDLVRNHGYCLDNETIIHSDQGSHYTSSAFIKLLKDNNFIQSMSRKGNCWDNSPQESFFGHMKDEILYYVSRYYSFSDVKFQVDDWMDYYNNERYQESLLKLSPNQFYEFTKTGIYPLEKYFPGTSWGS